MLGVRNPKQEIHHPAMLNVDQVVSMLDEEKTDFEDEFFYRDNALMELLYGSGLRISEALALNVQDYKQGSKEIKVFGKGGKERFVPFQTRAAKPCGSGLKKELLLLRSIRKKPFS